MARVVALVPDLLFGSQVRGALTAAGHEVELVGDGDRTRERLVGTSASGAADAERGEAARKDAPAVLVVDLVNQDLDGAALVETLAAEGLLERTRTLGFYSHVDAPARERAERAGFDLVVPRSRMAREGAELVAGLLRQC
jgi:CheY-like chemotaxis protein